MLRICVVRRFSCFFSTLAVITLSDCSEGSERWLGNAKLWLLGLKIPQRACPPQLTPTFWNGKGRQWLLWGTETKVACHKAGAGRNWYLLTGTHWSSSKPRSNSLSDSNYNLLITTLFPVCRTVPGTKLALKKYFKEY